MLSAAGRRPAKIWLRTSAGADPSSLSQLSQDKVSLSQDKDHLSELLTFAIMDHFRNIRPGSGSTFVNSYPEAR